MKNLAGDLYADKTILEELYLADIPKIKIDKSSGEVPYTFIGRIGKWTFRRRWYYWSAVVDEGEVGLPLGIAMELHYKKHPVTGVILGETVRCGGDGSVPPDDYVSRPIYNGDFESKLENLGYKKEYHNFLKQEYIQISDGEVAKLCNEGKLDVERYVDTYHIDDQIGLNEFVKVIKSLENNG